MRITVDLPDDLITWIMSQVRAQQLEQPKFNRSDWVRNTLLKQRREQAALIDSARKKTK